MVKIRLARAGKRNDPSFRVVVIDSQRKNTGKTIANVGYWYPKKDELKLDRKQIKEWLAKGAQMTPRVKKLYEKTT